VVVNLRQKQEYLMSMHARLLGVGAAALLLGIAFLAATGRAADDKGNKEVREAVLKLAAAVEKSDAAEQKKQTEALKKEDLSEIMDQFKLRKSGGIGVGSTPGAHTPDGIELKIINLGKKALAKSDLDKQADDIAKAAYVAAAIAELAQYKCPVQVKKGEKDPKDWQKWSAGMKESALELAKAAKAKDPAKVHAAAGKLNSNCQNCHGVFRD
jgi:cytochrome c556